MKKFIPLKFTSNNQKNADKPPQKPTLASSSSTSSTLGSNKRKFVSPLSISQKTAVPKTDIPSSKPSIVVDTAPTGDEAYYTCYWRKKTNKKHKNWDGDAILITRGSTAILKDVDDGKEIGKCNNPQFKDLLGEGCEFSISGKDIEINGSLNSDEYKSGRIFLSHTFVPNKPVVPFTSFKPITSTNCLQVDKKKKVYTARHNADAVGAVVLPRPDVSNKKIDIVDVVVDPILAVHLRPHQIEGVSFMYSCIMGFKAYQGNGIILADEMGLGKTLQAITLIWTLLKQSPYPTEKSIINRALILCPASLVKNWQKEFNKWLGTERIKVLPVDSTTQIQDFTVGRVYSVLICGYEKMRNFKELFSKGFDLVVCDEGHRLKNASIKTSMAVNALKTTKRIILTGTPIQNHLSEFHAMCDFVNPGILGSVQTFKRVYEGPIMASRYSKASREEVSLGEMRAGELSRLTRMFVLRRGGEVNNAYLPPKTEYVVFCRPTQVQVKLYRELLGSIGDEPADVLGHLTTLKLLVNSPNLIKSEIQTSKEIINNSGKLIVLMNLLRIIKQSSNEKVVLISNYTKTLDIFESLIKEQQYNFVRLDGKTNVTKRQEIVDTFNRDENIYLFLLSSKAGGVGLNLIGASRLILFDIDWNPSVCKQAMARIWRDGQGKNVFIYRFLTVGTIEERIFQRQVTKCGLADSVVDDVDSGNGFSREELKDLFSLVMDTECLTHDLLGCGKCEVKGVVKQVKKKDGAKLVELMNWDHYRINQASENLDIEDKMLKMVLDDQVQFLMSKKFN